jgi:hypothetical protein
VKTTTNPQSKHVKKSKAAPDSEEHVEPSIGGAMLSEIDDAINDVVPRGAKFCDQIGRARDVTAGSDSVEVQSSLSSRSDSQKNRGSNAHVPGTPDKGAISTGTL